MTISVVTVYHSGYGHTSVVAEAVNAGVGSVEGVKATLIDASTLNSPEVEGFAALDRQCGRNDLWFSDLHGLCLCCV